jgi:hypothetical protein
VAYFAVTGHPPFDAPNTTGLLALHLTQSPPAVLSKRPDLPVPLAKVIDRLLQKEPAERFASGEELVTALETLRAARPEVAPALRLFHQRSAMTLRVLFLVLAFAPYMISRARHPGDALVVTVAFLAAIGMMVTTIMENAQQLLRQGFRYDDVSSSASALSAEQEEAASALQASVDFAGRARRRNIRAVALLTTAPLLFAFAALRLRHEVNGTSALGFSGMLVISLAAVLFVVGVATLFNDERRRLRIERRLEKLWTGRFGETFFRLAARGVDRERERMARRKARLERELRTLDGHSGQ